MAMGKKVSIDQLADAVNEQLQEYNKLSAEVVKTAVTKAGNAVKKDIGANAPKKTGRYAKSWRTKKTKETSTELQVTVYSPTRYMLAHLLEHGHAKRGGGRSGRDTYEGYRKGAYQWMKTRCRIFLIC